MEEFNARTRVAAVYRFHGILWYLKNTDSYYTMYICLSALLNSTVLVLLKKYK